jgi:hypothetical protein
MNHTSLDVGRNMEWEVSKGRPNEVLLCPFALLSSQAVTLEEFASHVKVN